MLYLGAKKSLLSSGKTLAAQIAALFASGEQGAWYEPSLTNGTLFQDAAGTTPVTAVGQPVGLMLDKSGRGNHATQPTAINRPVLSARVNLLVGTDSPSTSNGWSNVEAMLGGGNIVPNTNVVQHYIYQATVAPGSATMTFTAKANGYTRIMVREGTLTGNMVVFDLSIGTIAATSGYTGSITPSATTGAYDCTVFLTGKSSAAEAVAFVVGNASTTSWVTAVFAGNGTSGVLLSNTHLQVGTLTRYQRVNTATDYDAVSLPFFGDHNGTNSSTSSATGGGGNAGFFLCQAVKPKGGAGAARTIWSDAGENTGYRVRVNASNQLELSAGNGTAYTSITSVATLPVGETHLITALDDGVNLNVQIDAGAVASVARPVVLAGTAGFTVGADNGTAANFFPGNLYAEVYRQVAPNTAQIASAQRYCKSKAGL